jgi:protein arginine N-methyltransferase 1
MIEFQWKILGDRVRNQALADALARAVQPGMTVIDIGSGTGFLSFLASKLGAKECICVEQGEVITLAKKLADENGITNCRFVEKHSSEIKKLPPADLVVSETLGNFALEEHLIENMEDAKRFLKKGGRLIPSSLIQCVAPVVTDRLWKNINVWDDIGQGLTFASAKKVALNNMYVQSIHRSDIEADSVRQWDEIDFRKKNASLRRATIEWHYSSATIIYGFALWWRCAVIDDIILSTSPFDEATHWEQIFLPLSEPVAIAEGQKLVLSLSSDSRLTIGLNMKWDTEVYDGKKSVGMLKMDMRKGNA